MAKTKVSQEEAEVIVEKKATHKWCFPREGVVIEAESQSEALDKLAEMKKGLK